MNCVKCGSVSNLMDSQGLGITVRRLRQCPKCYHKFFTYEIPEKFLRESEEFVNQAK